MELLGPTFERLGPCIAAGGVGWMLRQSFFTETDAETVAKFSQWITLPSLILHTLVPLTLSDVATYLPAIFAFAVPVSLTAATAWIVARTSHPKERGLLAGVSVGSSVSSVGVPLAAAFLGPAGLVASLFCTLIDVIASYFASYALFATAGPAFPESFVHADGGTYRGEWKGMIKEGHGVYTYPSGARYEGEWREGLKEGRGVYHFPKGGIYEGEWRGGVMAGVGVRTFATGKVRSGVWEKGKLAVPMEEWQCALAVEGASEAATVAKRVVVGGADFASAFRRLATQPAVAAFVVAGVLIATQRPLTPTAAMVVQKLAAAHVPLALLAFGLNMDLSPPQKHQIKDVRLALSLRLLPPLLFASAASIFMFWFGNDANVAWFTTVLGAATLCSLGPAPASALHHAHIFRLNENAAAATIRSTTAVALGLVPLVGAAAAASASASGALPLAMASGLSAIGVVLASLVSTYKARPPSAHRPEKVRMVYAGTAPIDPGAVADAVGPRGGSGDVVPQAGLDTGSEASGRPQEMLPSAEASERFAQHGGEEDKLAKGEGEMPLEPLPPPQDAPPVDGRRRRNMFKDIDTGGDEQRGGRVHALVAKKQPCLPSILRTKWGLLPPACSPVCRHVCAVKPLL